MRPKDVPAPADGRERRCALPDDPKCASDPRVVCALRYGSKWERRLPSNATPASRTPSGAAAQYRPDLRGVPDLLPDITASVVFEFQRVGRAPRRPHRGRPPGADCAEEDAPLASGAGPLPDILRQPSHGDDRDIELVCFEEGCQTVRTKGVRHFEVSVRESADVAPVRCEHVDRTRGSPHRRSPCSGSRRTPPIGPPRPPTQVGTPTRSPLGVECPRQADRQPPGHLRRSLPGIQRTRWRQRFHRRPKSLAPSDASLSPLRLASGPDSTESTYHRGGI